MTYNVFGGTLNPAQSNPIQRTARRVASHPVVIALCRKLDAECDRQATVVGRLLTTLGDDRRAVAKLFLVQTLEKSSGGNYAYF